MSNDWLEWKTDRQGSNSALAVQPSASQRRHDEGFRFCSCRRGWGRKSTSHIVSSACSAMLIHQYIRVVQFGTELLLGQESNKGRVLGLLYGLSRLTIVFNNVFLIFYFFLEYAKGLRIVVLRSRNLCFYIDTSLCGALGGANNHTSSFSPPSRLKYKLINRTRY
jgi:hypothetical protein